VSLDFNQGDAAEIQLTAPDDPNLAPPGHYLLFLLDAAGVPAVAPVVQLVYV
jgi:hypothetical protein